MVKNGAAIASIKKILITQPRPETEKSPYFDLARKYSVELHFQPFIRLEGISAKEFRKQKIDIAEYSAVIFTSRNAIDHFFRICEELKLNISQDTKYFCITEAVALNVPDYSLPWIVRCDASLFAVGAVLYQIRSKDDGTTTHEALGFTSQRFSKPATPEDPDTDITYLRFAFTAASFSSTF